MYRGEPFRNLSRFDQKQKLQEVKLAVVGATGLVGSEILEVLKERNFEYDELMLVASARSVGKVIEYKGEAHTVIGLEDAVAAKPDIAIFLCWWRNFIGVGT